MWARATFFYRRPPKTALEWRPSPEAPRRDPIDFHASLRDEIGVTLRLELVAEPHELVQEIFFGREFHLLAGKLPVAHLRYGDQAPALVEIACKEERWRLTKHWHAGWDLSLERTTDSIPIGRYRGRHWRAGGTIELIDGGSVTVRHRPGGRWRLAMPGAKPFVELRPRRLRSRRNKPLRLTIKSVPAEMVSLHLFVLTVCGVILLEDEVASMSAFPGE